MTTEDRSFFITGDRVGLARQVTSDQRPAYENWLDPEVQRAFNARPPWSDFDEFVAFRSSPERTAFRFAATVVDLRDGTARGVVTLAPEEREPDVSINLFRESRGSGYGLEALRLAVEYIFRELDLDYVVAGVYEHNPASIRIMKSVGFHRDPPEDLTEPCEFGSGEVRQLAFRLSRSEWERGVRRGADPPRSD